MPEDRACRSTITEKTEPPSRRSQYALVEALTTAAVDGNLSSLLSILCGYTRFPFVILILGHIFAIVLALLYGKAGITLIAEHLNFTNQDGLAMLFSMVVQGIGYFFAEMLHHKSSRYLRQLNTGYNTTTVVLAKNLFLILSASLLQITTNSCLLIDFAYGALYAAIISTLHDIVYGTPSLKRCLAYLMGHIISILTIVKQKTQHKPFIRFALYGLLIYVGFLTSNAYASYETATGIPTYIMIFASTLGLLEQTLVYEYAYRAAYYLYRQLTSKNLLFEFTSIINYLLRLTPKNLSKPTLFS